MQRGLVDAGEEPGEGGFVGVAGGMGVGLEVLLGSVGTGGGGEGAGQQGAEKEGVPESHHRGRGVEVLRFWGSNGESCVFHRFGGG